MTTKNNNTANKTSIKPQTNRRQNANKQQSNSKQTAIKRSPCAKCWIRRYAISHLDIELQVSTDTGRPTGGRLCGSIPNADLPLIRPCRDCDRRLDYADSYNDGCGSPEAHTAYLYDVVRRRW